MQYSISIVFVRRIHAVISPCILYCIYYKVQIAVVVLIIIIIVVVIGNELVRASSLSFGRLDLGKTDTHNM